MASIRKRGSKYEVQIRRANCKSSTKSFIKLSDAKKWARMMEVKADRSELPASQADLKQYTLRNIPLRENPLDRLKKLKVSNARDRRLLAAILNLD